MILKASHKPHDDEFNISIVDTLKVKKYRHIVKWYQDKNNLDYEKKLKIKLLVYLTFLHGVDFMEQLKII